MPVSSDSVKIEIKYENRSTLSNCAPILWQMNPAEAVNAMKHRK